MCGIVGYIGEQDALAVILAGLEKLEYRGYDSAGVAMYEDAEMKVFRAQGKLSELKKVFATRDPNKRALLAIGHTRWAPHGKPSENNAHPHTAGRVSIIHNGIIENYTQLREELSREGCVFKSETDTEIAAHLCNKHLEEGLPPFEAFKRTCEEIRGSYAFLVVDSHNPDRILIAKNASPIVLGIGHGEYFVASDIPAVLAHTRNIIILEDGDVVELTEKGPYIENSGKKVSRPVTVVAWDPVTAQKGGYKHFMLKEIHDQPQVIGDTFRGRIDHAQHKVYLPELGLSERDVRQIDRMVLVACGTAWHASLVAKYYIEQLARIPVEVDLASEFRYRNPILTKNTLVMAISQSGETADTLAAIELASKISPTMAICNVLGSSLPRKVKYTLFTHAGPEISVASTKAFSTQLAAVYVLAVYLGQMRGVIPDEKAEELLNDMLRVPVAVDEALKRSHEIEAVARGVLDARDFLYLGRGVCFPIALEGALKLKEISYVHAEGYAAGEMKHGPIALVDEKVPVVVVLQRSDVLFEKTLSNLREVESRGARVIAVTDISNHRELARVASTIIEVPHVSELLSPIVLTVPLQLLAYYVAVLNGTDVDLPRNLAKSVTVE